LSPSLKVSDLAKSFGSRAAVGGVDLEVAPGQVVGLLGPNGAGKTTTFQLILGIVKPDRGRVQFDIPLDGLPLHKRARLGLGYLPQTPSVFRGLSVRDNLLAILEQLRPRGAAARADELLDQFGLTHLSRQKARTLSGGERRRLEFARALLSDPAILLCDEPFSGVDPIAVQEIAGGIGELSRKGLGILMTDHSVRDALNVCHLIHLIVDGRIVESGTPDEIRGSDNARRLYLGEGF
jgi:lipopolysaccharide export system ATP-binding protein